MLKPKIKYMNWFTKHLDQKASENIFEYLFLLFYIFYSVVTAWYQ